MLSRTTVPLTVHFCRADAALRIWPNGALDLSGTLTSGCDGTWKGVEVWGISGLSQFPIGGVWRQGRLFAQEGSIIENAVIGAQLYGLDIVSTAGGQIRGIGATFRNNIKGVVFAPYNNDLVLSSSTVIHAGYAGSFSTCTFITDNSYPHAEDFHSFAFMAGVKGVHFTGCSFTNTKDDTPSSSFRGYGIHATDAGFNVTSFCNVPFPAPIPCPNIQYTEFKNLEFGIHSSKAMDNKPFNVNNSKFYNCNIGIYNKGVSGASITANNFRIMGNEGPGDYFPPAYDLGDREDFKVVSNVPMRKNFLVVKPNPAKGQTVLEINLPNKSENILLNIVNINGISMQRFSNLNPTDELFLNVESFSNGIYFYQLIVDGKTYESGKIIVSN